ncbi:MAG TPA: SUMF1/EgtB/PvdO family nonheme iron enzyme [Polyangiaceae bacterium]
MRSVTLGWLAIMAVGCRRDTSTSPSDASPMIGASAVRPAEVASATALSTLLGDVDSGAQARKRSATGARADERIQVPTGRFMAGSLPGDEGREPRSEPIQLPFSLSAYEIDRLPYPNDPAQPPRTDLTRREAARLCAQRGERLCSELEWENACKGTANDAYATGDAWDPACSREPTTCASGLGVLGMGALREWTASDVLSLDKDDKSLGAVRGASPSAEPNDHRCARRIALASTAHARDIGFRCCTGSPNAATIPATRLGPAAKKISLDPAQLAQIFAGIPQLASVKDSIRYFAEPDDTATVLRRGRTAQGPADLEGFTLTTSPLLWNPAPGEEVVVVLGHGAKDSFIVALYRLPENRYRLASSLLLVNDLGPFALAYHPEVRERLIWSSCWKCTGEGGTVSLRDGRRIIIVQQ